MDRSICKLKPLVRVGKQTVAGMRAVTAVILAGFASNFALSEALVDVTTLQIGVKVIAPHNAEWVVSAALSMTCRDVTIIRCMFWFLIVACCAAAPTRRLQPQS